MEVAFFIRAINNSTDQWRGNALVPASSTAPHTPATATLATVENEGNHYQSMGEMLLIKILSISGEQLSISGEQLSISENSYQLVRTAIN